MKGCGQNPGPNKVLGGSYVFIRDRIRAVKFYINCGYNAAYTVRKLGYPDVTQIVRWYREYSRDNDLHHGRKKVSKYSDKEKRVAVDYYFSHDRNALKTVKSLGYPSRPLLLEWVKELYPEEGERRCKSFKPHVRCSQEEKIQAVMESCKGNLKISQRAEIYSSASYFMTLGPPSSNGRQSLSTEIFSVLFLLHFHIAVRGWK